MVADRAVDWFFRGGLMQRDYDRIKLHITVMNTLFRKDPSGTGLQQEEGGSRERESFDATNVLQVLYMALISSAGGYSLYSRAGGWGGVGFFRENSEN